MRLRCVRWQHYTGWPVRKLQRSTFHIRLHTSTPLRISPGPRARHVRVNELCTQLSSLPLLSGTNAYIRWTIIPRLCTTGVETPDTETVPVGRSPSRRPTPLLLMSRDALMHHTVFFIGSLAQVQAMKINATLRRSPYEQRKKNALCTMASCANETVDTIARAVSLTQRSMEVVEGRMCCSCRCFLLNRDPGHLQRFSVDITFQIRNAPKTRFKETHTHIHKHRLCVQSACSPSLFMILVYRCVAS